MSLSAMIVPVGKSRFAAGRKVMNAAARQKHIVRFALHGRESHRSPAPRSPSTPVQSLTLPLSERNL